MKQRVQILFFLLLPQQVVDSVKAEHQAAQAALVVVFVQQEHQVQETKAVIRQ
jgi:hypothetical protein